MLGDFVWWKLRITKFISIKCRHQYSNQHLPANSSSQRNLRFRWLNAELPTFSFYYWFWASAQKWVIHEGMVKHFKMLAKFPDFACVTNWTEFFKWIRWCLALASVRPQWRLLWHFYVCACVCACVNGGPDLVCVMEACLIHVIFVDCGI